MHNVVITSLYGNPLHLGHIDYLEVAKNQWPPSFHICIVNNDKQVKLKGSIELLDEETRLGIVQQLQCVDLALLSIDGGRSVANTLGMLGTLFKYHSVIFYNSGDRSIPNKDEKIVCERYNIQMRFLSMPKLNSSSEIKKKLKNG